ncbi:MAG: D-alanyl-D-alanine carboxypeptidase/D-alanyl-D-alanine endopeptidase [Halothiobacillaceae bacterium]
MSSLRSLLLVLLCLAVSPVAAELPSEVTRELSANRLSADRLGVWIQAVDADKPLLAHNPDLALNPASVMKLVTSMAALDLLGPTYQWPTELFSDGPINRGTLEGNVYIKGYGDPWMRTEDLWQVIRQLHELGIHTITGQLVIDDSYFARTEEDPAAFDNRPDRPYNALPRALLFENRVTRFVVQPDRDTGAIRIQNWPPQPESVELINQIEPDNAGCSGRNAWPVVDIRLQEEADRVLLRGSYSPDCGVREFYRVVGNPEEAFYNAFVHLFGEKGGVIEGGYRVGQAPEGARLLFTHRSRPLVEYLSPINKWSNNVMARQLFLTLGADQLGPPATELKGRQAIDAWLRVQDLEFPEFVIENGSGLSRISRISARNLGKLLQRAWQKPTMPEFVGSMAIIGVDGTMRRRFRGEPVAGQGHFKTGTLRDVRAGAGYLQAASGQRYLVVVLHNQPTVQSGGGTRVQDALLDWLYRNG